MTSPRSPDCVCWWSLQKGGDLVRKRQAVRFAAAADWADLGAYPVSFMCTEPGVSRSGYYALRAAEPSQRALDDTALTAITGKLPERAQGNPGVARMRIGLAALGHLESRKRVHRLMQAAGLRGRRPLGLQAHHHRRRQPVQRPGPDQPPLHRRASADPPVRRRHPHQDVGRIGLPGHRRRPALQGRRRLGRRRAHAHQPGHRSPRHGHIRPETGRRDDISLRPGLPVNLIVIRCLLREE